MSALPVTGHEPTQPWAGPPERQAPLILASARWPHAPGDQLPPIAGFITSSFSPLVAELAERCLRGYFGAPPADPGLGARTAVLLVSSSGDVVTSAAIAAAVDAGRRVPPLLFYQSNPNAVVGYLSARWGLAGPVVCTMPPTSALADAQDSALLLLADGDADAVLLIVAEQDTAAGAGDHGLAQLIGPDSWPAGATPAQHLIPADLSNGGGF